MREIMKLSALATATMLAILPMTAIAGSVNVNVGDIACYDRLGPFNVIGVVVGKRSGEIQLQTPNGKTKWYKASKFRNVRLCKLTDAGIKWALEKGVDIVSQ